MSEQPVDLQAVWAVLRRRSRLLVSAGLLGAMGGGALLALVPPAYTSTSVVLLPSVAQSGSGRTGGYDAETQVLIVQSSEIMERAARAVTPRLTETVVRDRVSVDAPATAILHITASGPTAGRAEDLALAVAQSLVTYLEDTRLALSAARRAQLQDRLRTLEASLTAVNGELKKATDRIAVHGKTTPAGLADAAALSDLTAVRAATVLDVDALKAQLSGGEDAGGGGGNATASVIQASSPGSRPDYATDAAARVVGGAAFLLLSTVFVLLATNQRAPKLRSRDEIADAVDIPVLASLRVRPPRTAGAWVDLLRRYEPDSVDGWALRRLLHALTPDLVKEGSSVEPQVLVVMCLSGDAAALSVAPQIAAFAASTGIRTQLVAAQHHDSATTLWAACSQAFAREGMPAALAVGTVVDSSVPVALSVRLVVLDRTAPRPEPSVVANGLGVLAVSSAAATRRNLADAVVAADQVGLVVRGIVVANPDPLDRTSGRLAPVEREPVGGGRLTRIAGGAQQRLQSPGGSR